MAENEYSLEELLMEASYAEWSERWHQEKCRGRAAGLECRVCLDREEKWLAADLKLAAFVGERAEREGAGR